VVPIHDERPRERKKKKKARPAAARRPKHAPVVAQEPKPSEKSSGAGWLLLLAVAGVAGLWLVTRSGNGEEAPAVESPQAAVEAPAVEAPAPQVEAVAQPVEPPPAPIERAVAEAPPPPEPEAKAPGEPIPAPAPAIAPPSGDASESARTTAFKAVVEATKNARNCRHRGDTSGKVPVVVEFGNDGIVERTSVKASFSNPMTAQCITSKFRSLAIPSFTGSPILVTADVSLR
jgi:hypothetical protein